MKMASTSGKKSLRRRGVFTFEWILLISLLVIGVIGGLTAVRNSLICELNDLTVCIEAIACCDENGSPPPAPNGFGHSAQDGHAGCATCGTGAASPGGWWDNQDEW